MLLLLFFFFFFRFTGIKQKSKAFTFSWNPCTKFSIPSHCNDVLVSLCYCYYALMWTVFLLCVLNWKKPSKIQFLEFSYFSSAITINFSSSKYSVKWFFSRRIRRPLLYSETLPRVEGSTTYLSYPGQANIPYISLQNVVIYLQFRHK